VGAACEVARANHGFHGCASVDSWSIDELSPAEVLLSWTGHGLTIKRRVRLEDSALKIQVEAQASVATAPFLFAEHVAIGPAVLDPEVILELPKAKAYEWGTPDGPTSAPAAAPEWPLALGLDGEVSRVDDWAFDQVGSRLLTVADVKAGHATVRNSARRIQLDLDWEPGLLKDVWVWREERTSGGPWRGTTSMLVLEPASIPHDRGLAVAIERGEASWLEPGHPISYRISLGVRDPAKARDSMLRSSEEASSSGPLEMGGSARLHDKKEEPL
jgi:hypothetical protein